MQRLLNRGVETLLLVGERDVGIMNVEFHFRKEMKALERHSRFHRVTFTGVDHLFTSLYAQDVMLEAVTKHLQVTHPAMKSTAGEKASQVRSAPADELVP